MTGRVFITLVIFLLSSSHALADRFYAGANVAVTNIESTVLGSEFQNRPVGFRLNAGYAFSEFFALEGSYMDSGEADDAVSGQDVTLETTGYIMSLVFQTNLTTPSLFTKVGYYNGEVEGSTLGLSLDNDEDGFAAGVGFRHQLQYDMTPVQIAIRGDVDWIESELDNLWSVGIGLELSFGN